MILGEHLDQSRPETAPWTFWLHEPVCSSWLMPVETKSAKISGVRPSMCWSWAGLERSFRVLPFGLWGN